MGRETPLQSTGGLGVISVMMCVRFTSKGNTPVKAGQAVGDSICVYSLGKGFKGSRGLDQVDQIPFYRYAQNLTGLKGSVNLSGRQSASFPKPI